MYKTRTLNVFVFFGRKLSKYYYHAYFRRTKSSGVCLKGGKCGIHNLNISQQKKSFPFHLSELTFRFWYLDYIKVSHRVETMKYRTSQVMI